MSICTLTDLNPGFGGPREMLGIFFFKCHLKEVFWPKKVLNSMHGFKSATLAIFQLWQNGTFERMYGIQKFFWPKDFF